MKSDLFLKKLDALQTFNPEGFRLGAKEKMNDRETQILEFTVPIEIGQKSPAVCNLWMDGKTGLPMKRTLEFTNRDGKMERVVELYTNWQIAN